MKKLILVMFLFTACTPPARISEEKMDALMRIYEMERQLTYDVANYRMPEPAPAPPPTSESPGYYYEDFREEEPTDSCRVVGEEMVCDYYF